MRVLKVATGALMLCAGLTGCGGSDEEGSTEGKPVSPTTTLESSVTPSADPTGAVEPNVGERALRVGQPRVGRDITTKLLEIKFPYPPEEFRRPEKAGNVFLGFRVAQCLRKEAEVDPEAPIQSTYNGEWYAVTPGGAQYAGSGSSWNDWPTPKFPETVTLNPGDCLKGWIATEVPANIKVKKIVWRPDGQTLAEWLP